MNEFELEISELEEELEEVQTELDRIKNKLQKLKEDKDEYVIVKVQYPGTQTTYSYWARRDERLKIGEYGEVYSAMTCKLEIVKIVNVLEPGPTIKKPISKYLVTRHVWSPKQARQVN